MESEAEIGAGSRLSLKNLLFPGGDGDLVDSQGVKVDNSVIEGKTLGILVGPAWWKPMMLKVAIPGFAYGIRGLIHQVKPLKMIYVPLKRDDELIEQLTDYGRGGEIDTTSDEESFSSFIKSLPSGWLAVPVSNTVAIEKLTEVAYGRGNFVGLAFVGTDGKVLIPEELEDPIEWDTEAMPFTEEELKDMDKAEMYQFPNQKVEELQVKADAEKEALPANQTLVSLLVTEERDYVVDHENKKVKVSSLVGKTVGLYFSAHWCPPCRSFTPKLAQIYNELKEQGKPFEIIFISSDRDEEAFKTYFSEQRWLALPYNDRENNVNTKQKLGEYFNVEGIPRLIILGPDGRTVNEEGRYSVEKFGAKGFPFEEEEENLLKKWYDEIHKRHVEITIPDHEHPLRLMRVPYKTETYYCDICNACSSPWAYRCDDCGFDVDVQCIDKTLAKACWKVFTP